jgi:hypothetical protein
MRKFGNSLNHIFSLTIENYDHSFQRACCFVQML